MEINIVLAEKGWNATYAVEQVDNSIYNLRLVSYNGESMPLLYLKIFKTEQGWASAYNDAVLIHCLGSAIESSPYK